MCDVSLQVVRIQFYMQGGPKKQAANFCSPA